MRHRLVTLLLAGVVAAAAVVTWLVRASNDVQAPYGAIVWQDGFESGSLDGWDEAQSACASGYDRTSVGDTCIEIVRTPRRSGEFAASFRIGPQREGDTGAPRAELYLSRDRTGAYEGQEWVYAWSTFFPADGGAAWWTGGGDWNYVSQFHNADGDCGPTLAVGVDATGPVPELYFEQIRQDDPSCGGSTTVRKHLLGRLEEDRWYEFVLRVLWSSRPGRGSVDLWVDGEHKAADSTSATMHDGEGAYWKLGVYRGATEGRTRVVHDDARRAAPLP